MTASKFTRTATAQAAAPKARAPRARAAQPTNAAPQHEEDVIDIPSASRVFASTALGLGTYGASFYGTMGLVNLATTAAMTLTGVGFISFMVWFLGAVIAIVSSLRLGYFVASKVLGYQPGDLAGVGESISLAAASKVSLVRGWFTRSDLATA